MSFTTYTYTRTLRNVNILMSIISETFTQAVHSHNFDPISNTLSIVCKTPLAFDEKNALDILVRNFNDNNSLTEHDQTSFKNVRLYKTSDQPISATLNSVTEVLFQSSSHVDRQYYTLPHSNRFVTITKPGTYLVIARVGAQSSSTITGNNNSIQWGISFDDTKTDIAYITVPNANVYTIHSNVNNMVDSTMLTAILNVNAVNGTNLRLTARRVLGSTPMAIRADCTSLQIMSIPGAAFYEGNTNANVVATSTPTPLLFGVNRINQFPFVHTTGQSFVSVSQNGYIFVMAKVTFNKTSGSDATTGTLAIRLNGTPVPTLTSSSHVIAGVSNKTTVHAIGVLKVNENDAISVTHQLNSGTSMQIPSTESGLAMVFLNPYIFRNIKCGSFSPSITSSSLTLNPSDVVVNQTNLIVPTSPVTIQIAAGQMTFVKGGMYLISGNVVLNNSSANTREVGLYISVSVDGKTNVIQPSTFSMKQSYGGNRHTVTLASLLDLPAYAKVKIQATSGGVSTDNITIVPEGTHISVINFTDMTDIEDDHSHNFGSRFNMVVSADDLTVSSSTYVEKCRIIAHNLQQGLYRVGINTTFSLTVPTTINVQLLDVHPRSGTVVTAYSRNMDFPTGSQLFSSTDYITCTEGAHVFILQLSSPAGTSYVVRNTQMESWRAV